MSNEPRTKVVEEVTISKECLDKLLKTQKEMEALEEHNINRWEHYNDAMRSVQMSEGRDKILRDTIHDLTILIEETIDTGDSYADPLRIMLTHCCEQYSKFNNEAD